MPNLDPFTRAYLTAALWTSDPDPRSGEYQESDRWHLGAIEPDSLARAIEDCARFQAENKTQLMRAGDDTQNGIDFWLTRNGHGAGFWDRGYPKVIGERLTNASHACGEINVGPDDPQSDWDGVIYIE